MTIPSIKKTNVANTPEWLIRLEETTAKSYPHLPSKIQESLIIWRKRFEIYDDPEIAATLKNATNWKQNRRFRNESDKLIKAIHALDQLATTKTRPAHADIMQEAIIKIIEIKVTKLLLDQNKILSKAQNIHRNIESVANFPTDAITHKQKNIELEKMREESAKLLKERNEDFLKSTKENKLHHTHYFFKERESRWHYDKHIKRAQNASVILSFFNALINVFKEVIPALLSAGHVILEILKAIPFFGSIIAAIPIVMKVVKVWLKNQDDTKRGLAILGLLFLIGGFVTAGLAVVASTILTGVLIAIGGFINRVIPLINTQKSLSAHKDELKELNQSDEKLIPFLKLMNKRERQYLLIEAENAYVKNLVSKTDFMELKSDILKKDYYALKANPLIQKILEPKDFDTFLYSNIKQRKMDLEADIKTLTVKRNEHITGTINNIIALIGTLIFLISPPASAIILAISAVIGVSRQFNLTTRAIEGIKSLYYKIKNYFTDEKSAPTLQNINTNTLTAEILKAKENLKPVEKPEVTPSLNEDLKQQPASVLPNSLMPPKKAEEPKPDNTPPNKKPENQL